MSEKKNLIKPTIDIRDLVFLYQNDVISKLTLLDNLGLDPNVEKERGISFKEEAPSKEGGQSTNIDRSSVSVVVENESGASGTSGTSVVGENENEYRDLSEVFNQRLYELDRINRDERKRPKVIRVLDPAKESRDSRTINTTNGGLAFRQEQIDCLNDKAIKIDPVVISDTRMSPPEYTESKIIEKNVTKLEEKPVEVKKEPSSKKTKTSKEDKVEWKKNKKNKMGKVELYKNGKKIASQG